MKTIITALNFPQINKHIKENFSDRVEVVHEDLMYQEGLFEFLNNNPNLDCIILSLNLPGDGVNDYKSVELVKKLRSINDAVKIIIICDEDSKELRNSLYPLGVYDIFVSDKADYNQLIQAVENEEKIRIKETYIEVPVNYNVSKEIIENTEVILENADFRVVTFISATPSGKTVLSNNLAHMAAERDKKTALIDIDERKFEQFYYFDIDEKNIKADYGYKGYNKYNILFNALKENDVRVIPEISYQHNKLLHVYTGDVNEVNPEVKDIGKLLDRLRSIYNITIVDTGVMNDAVLEAISISDTVLFVQDMSFSSIQLNEKVLERLLHTANTKKFYLVINKYEKSNKVNPDVIIEYYKNEIGIEFKEVIIVPSNTLACLDGQWNREPAYKIKSVDEEFHRGIENLYKTLFGGTGIKMKDESLLRKLFRGNKK